MTRRSDEDEFFAARTAIQAMSTDELIDALRQAMTFLAVVTDLVPQEKIEEGHKLMYKSWQILKEQEFVSNGFSS